MILTESIFIMFQVIKLLHQRGELTEELKVKKKERVVEYSDDEDEDDDDAERTGSRKYYKHFPPFALADETEEFLYLHSIEMKLGELMLIQNECSPHFTFR